MTICRYPEGGHLINGGSTVFTSSSVKKLYTLCQINSVKGTANGYHQWIHSAWVHFLQYISYVKVIFTIESFFRVKYVVLQYWELKFPHIPISTRAFASWMCILISSGSVICIILTKMYITHSECAFGQYLLAWTDFVELPRSLLLIGQAPVVQTLDSAIHQINHYPADSVIDFRNTYRLDSDLSGG